MVGLSLSDARNLCGRRREYIGFEPDRTRAAPAPFERPGWIFHPRIISTLEKLKDAQRRYLAGAGLPTFDATGGGGTLLGFPFPHHDAGPHERDAGNVERHEPRLLSRRLRKLTGVELGCEQE